MLKAFAPMVLSALFSGSLKVTVLRAVAPINELTPMLVKLAGRLTSVSTVLPEKASFAMEVTPSGIRAIPLQLLPSVTVCVVVLMLTQPLIEQATSGDFTTQRTFHCTPVMLLLKPVAVAEIDAVAPALTFVKLEAYILVGALPRKTNLARFVASSKALSPIVVRLAGKVILVRFS